MFLCTACFSFFYILKSRNFLATNLQGVGYPLDIVVCSALGADMYDCVYPTRTARFGTALVPEVIASEVKTTYSLNIIWCIFCFETHL